MMKQNKWKIIITSLIILVPMFIGCILWEKLPDTMATHFDSHNVANGWSSKAFTVFGLSLFLLGIHLVCLFVTSADPKYKNIGEKPLGIVFWIVPGISLVAYAAIYANAFGVKMDSMFIVQIFAGVLIMVIGNILPKVRQNHVFGVRLPWTLDDEDNWRRTNRLAGWCMVAAGIVMIATSFLNIVWVLITVMIPACVIPIVYSYMLFRKKAKEAGK